MENGVMGSGKLERVGDGMKVMKSLGSPRQRSPILRYVLGMLYLPWL